MKEPWLVLTRLEVFFIATTIISLFVNVYQLMIWRKEQKTIFRPISNALIALFNDVKQKLTNVFWIQVNLGNPINPHKQIETLRWEYFHFLQGMISSLQGFQEALVGVLATMNPKDTSGAQAFRASDYGLTQEEKELRKKILEQMNAQMNSATQPVNQPQISTQPTTEAPSIERNDNPPVEPKSPEVRKSQ